MKKFTPFIVAGAWACSAPASPGAGGSSQVGGASGEDRGGNNALAARVVATNPLLDAADVYPAPLWSGNGEEVVVQIAFSEAMAPHSEFSFEALDHLRPAEATWSPDAKTLLVVTKADFAFPRPLSSETTYALDLTPLVGETGRELEPNMGLREGRLVFTTGRHDALLNHSCGHTFFGPFASVGAARTADDSAPDISKTHTEYTVTLQDNDDEYGGWLRANFTAPGQYRLYFDGETRVSLNDAHGEAQALSLFATPLACPGIAYEVTLHPRPGEELFLKLEAGQSPARRVIVERVPDDQ